MTLALLKIQLKDVDASLVLESAQAIARVQPRDRVLLDTLVRLAKETDTSTGAAAADLLKSSASRDPQVVAVLEPYRAREREAQIEKALASSTPVDRAVNARTLKINAIRVSKEIVDERPDHPGRSFNASVRSVYCWTAYTAATVPAGLRQVWFLDGKQIYDASLVAAESTGAVWSRRRVRPGKWHVDVMIPGSSEPLASASFTVFKN